MYILIYMYISMQVYMCVYAYNNNEKRDHAFERDQGGGIWVSFEGERKGKTIK